MDKRNQKTHIATALDIGSSSVKALRMKTGTDGVELLDLEVKNSVREVALLKEVKSVVISVSGPAVILRYVLFPKMSKEELAGSLRFEAQKHIPFPVGDLYLDSWILKPDVPENKMQVLLVAVKREAVRLRLESLKQAGVEASAIGVDAVALINAFNFNFPQPEKQDKQDKPQITALLNIGASTSNLSILERGLPCLSRDIHTGSTNVTQKIADALGVDAAAAEELKLNPDAERKDKVRAIFESVMTSLSGEIRTSFDFYESQSTSSVSKIFLSGGGSMFPECPVILKNLLGIEVEAWNPLEKVKLSSKVDGFAAAAASRRLVVALGMGLRGL